MKEKTKRIFITVISVMLLVTNLIACAGEKDDNFDTLGLPTYEGAVYEVAGDNSFNIKNATQEDLEKYVKLLRQDGYTFHYEGDNLTEETAIAEQFWQGKKDNTVVNVWLMVDLKSNSTYLNVVKVVK